MGSVALGGACWQGAVRMLRDASDRENIVNSSRPSLKKVFGDLLVVWLCNYWNKQTNYNSTCLYYLTKNTTGVDTEIMTLSLITSTEDLRSFVRFSRIFVTGAASCAKLLFQCIEN